MIIGKLKKMKMPEKKGEDMAGMEDMGMEEGSPEEEASESPDEAHMEGDDKMPENPELAKLSDDELLAEIKKRGLMADLHGADQQEAPADDELMNQ